MDPVTEVVTALAAGAGAGASGVVSAVALDAYNGLKTLVLHRLRRGGTEDDAQKLVAAADDQPAGTPALTAALTRVGVDDPMVWAARRLLESLRVQQGKYVLDASHAKGVIQGDHAVQHNTFD